MSATLLSSFPVTRHHSPYPFLSFHTVMNCKSRNSIVLIFMQNAGDVGGPASSNRALSSLFSLFAPRVFHNSFAFKRIHTLSRNSRVSINNSHSGTRHSSPATRHYGQVLSFQTLPEFPVYLHNSPKQLFQNQSIPHSLPSQRGWVGAAGRNADPSLRSGLTEKEGSPARMPAATQTRAGNEKMPT